MSKKKQKNSIFIKPVHFEALMFLVIYFIFSIFVFARLVSHSDTYISTLGPFVFGLLSTFIFLYLFSHKDFFKLGSALEAVEKKKEQKYLNKYLRYGKFVACLLIGQIAGPILLALTIRLMFPGSIYKYWIAALCVALNTFIAVIVAKGVLGFVI